MGADVTVVNAHVDAAGRVPRLNLKGLDTVPRVPTGLVSVAALADLEMRVLTTCAGLSSYLTVDSVTRTSADAPVRVHFTAFREGSSFEVTRIASHLASELRTAVSASVTFLRVGTPGNLAASILGFAQLHGVVVSKILIESGQIQIHRSQRGAKPFEIDLRQHVKKEFQGRSHPILFIDDPSPPYIVVQCPDQDCPIAIAAPLSDGSVKFPKLRTPIVGFVSLKEIEHVARLSAATMFPEMRVSSVRWQSPEAPIFIHFTTHSEGAIEDVARLTSRLAFDLDAAVAGSVTVVSPETPGHLAVAILNLARHHHLIVSQIRLVGGVVQICRCASDPTVFDREVSERLTLSGNGHLSVAFSDSFSTPATYFPRPAARIWNLKICGHPLGLPTPHTNGTKANGRPPQNGHASESECPEGYHSPVDALSLRFEEGLQAVGGVLLPGSNTNGMRVDFTGTRLLLERPELHRILGLLAKFKGTNHLFGLQVTLDTARAATADWPHQPYFMATDDGRTPNIACADTSLLSAREIGLIYRIAGPSCRIETVRARTISTTPRPTASPGAHPTES